MKPYIKTTINFYDKYLKEYIKNTKNLQNKEFIKDFISLLSKNARVLDLGCAWGRDSKIFVKHNLKTYGVDLSKNMIKYAKKYAPKADFKVMDILSLKFKKDFFDGVWASASLLHLKKKDIPKALKQIKKVLKLSGIFYINLKEGKGEELTRDQRYKGARKFYSYFTESEIRRLLTNNNFKIIKLKLIKPTTSYIKDKIIHLIAIKAEG